MDEEAEELAPPPPKMRRRTQTNASLNVTRSSRVTDGDDDEEEMSEECSQTTADTISNLLEDREQLKGAVLKVFLEVVPEGSDSLNLEGLEQFKAKLLEQLSIPQKAFGDLTTAHERFDFGGTGRLDVNEAYKLVKFHLWEYLQEIQGADAEANVRSITPNEAGYTVTKRLGQGNQAVVWYAKDTAGRERCIKCYSKDKMPPGAVSTLLTEFRAMQLVGCKRIAQVYEIFQDEFSYYLVSDVYTGGDFQLLRSRVKESGTVVDEDWWRRLFKQCFRALVFMHQNAVMHCDIKEANLMLKNKEYQQPEVVVVDFGVTKAMGAIEKKRLCGTPGYIPPETFCKRQWFPGGDVFSLGVVMFQMLTDTTPPPDAKYAHETKGLFLEGCMKLEDVRYATMNRQPPWELFPSEFRGLAAITRGALEKDHQSRPRAPRILLHPCFAKGRRGHPLQEASHRDSGPLTGRHRLATDGMIIPDYIQKFREEEGRLRNASIDEEDEECEDAPSTIAPELSVGFDTSTSEIDSQSSPNTTQLSVDSPDKPAVNEGPGSDRLGSEAVPTEWAAAVGIKLVPNASDTSTPAWVHPSWPCKSVEASGSRPRAHSGIMSPTPPLPMAEQRPRAQSYAETSPPPVQGAPRPPSVPQRRSVASSGQPPQPVRVGTPISVLAQRVAGHKDQMSAAVPRQRALSETSRVCASQSPTVVARQRSQSSLGFTDSMVPAALVQRSQSSATQRDVDKLIAAPPPTRIAVVGPPEQRASIRRGQSAPTAQLTDQPFNPLSPARLTPKRVPHPAAPTAVAPGQLGTAPCAAVRCLTPPPTVFSAPSRAA